ncbi:MAG: hypothetical protein M0Q91_17450 [Methanoregula sp.]|jgi:hypothetical protein|nr:hypothetical protein [Methanoregula sp.]
MAFPILALAAGALGGAALSLAAFAPGFGDIITGFMNGTFRARIPTPAELGRMRQMGIITAEDYSILIVETGFSAKNAERIWNSTLDAIPVGDILRLWYRYQGDSNNYLGVDYEWTIGALEKAGVRGDQFRYLIEANRPVPTVQDEIVFAVRDVYEPEAVEQAQLLSGIPEAWIERVARLGLRREDAEKFWAAHWSVPSLTQVYEMFHRLYVGSGHEHTFTEADMDVFFNIADIAPGYRERLKEISYNPLTRVDIRRMYAYGQYGSGESSRQALIRDYRQIGYSPADAQRLAKFTMDEYGEGRKKFTQSQIVKFYNNKLWGEETKEKAIEELKRLGYDDTQAGLLLSYIDLVELTKEEQDKIETIRQQWLSGEIDDPIVLETALVKVPMTVEQARKYEAQFERDRAKQTSRLTRSEIDSFYANNLISESEYRTYLRNLGYIEKDIALIVRLAGNNRVAPLAKPSKEDILGWYTENVISDISFVRLMREIGYRDELIQYFASGIGLTLDDKITRDMEDLPEDDDYEI